MKRTSSAVNVIFVKTNLLTALGGMPAAAAFPEPLVKTKSFKQLLRGFVSLPSTGEVAVTAVKAPSFEAHKRVFDCLAMPLPPADLTEPSAEGEAEEIPESENERRQKRASPGTIGRLLAQRGHAFASLVQIDAILKLSGKGDFDLGLSLTGRNLFPVLTKNGKSVEYVAAEMEDGAMTLDVPEIAKRELNACYEDFYFFCNVDWAKTDLNPILIER